MERDERIRPVRKDTFRHKLYSEDVWGYDVQRTDDNQVAGFYIDNPIKFGNIGMFYRFKLGSRSDVYYAILCQRLAYLNPGINNFGLKRLAEYALNNFVKYEDGKYAISNEEFVAGVSMWLNGLAFSEHLIESELVAVYPRESGLTKEQKRTITLIARDLRVQMTLGVFVHAAAMLAIEKEPDQLLITNSRLLPYCGEKIKTTKTLVKRAEPRTITALEDANRGRPFKTEVSVKKYEQYLNLPVGTSGNKAQKKLGISRSTVSLFKKLKDGI